MSLSLRIIPQASLERIRGTKRGQQTKKKQHSIAWLIGGGAFGLTRRGVGANKASTRVFIPANGASSMKKKSEI